MPQTPSTFSIFDPKALEVPDFASARSRVTEALDALRTKRKKPIETTLNDVVSSLNPVYSWEEVQLAAALRGQLKMGQPYHDLLLAGVVLPSSNTNMGAGRPEKWSIIGHEDVLDDEGGVVLDDTGAVRRTPIYAERRADKGKGKVIPRANLQIGAIISLHVALKNSSADYDNRVDDLATRGKRLFFEDTIHEITSLRRTVRLSTRLAKETEGKRLALDENKKLRLQIEDIDRMVEQKFNMMASKFTADLSPPQGHA